MAFISSLNREQKEAMGLLQIGTVLEYFDLMLYVHMAVVLNALFFPETDPFTASLVAAFSFCSSFVFRPFGALLFGYIGDNIGRKATVVITTSMMGVACLGMILIPTYAEVGIKAALFLTLCRAIQGISSIGELIGAEIYLTETIKLPARYPAVAWVVVSASLGELLALAVANAITIFHFDWRYAFVAGLSIAAFGSVARICLRETPDFIEAKRRQKGTPSRRGKPLLEKINYTSVAALFIIFLGWPVYFYFAYVHCGNLLRDVFHYSPGQIIQHNLYLALLTFVTNIFVAHICYKIYPLTIIKFKLCILLPFILLCPVFLTYIGTPFQLFLIQSVAVVFGLAHDPAGAIFYKHLPVLKRVTSASLTFAVARALMYIISSFGLVFLTAWMGHWGLWVVMIPGAVGFTWAILYFEKIDKPERETMNAPLTAPSLKEAA